MKLSISKFAAIAALFLLTFAAATMGTMFGNRMLSDANVPADVRADQPIVLNADSAARGKSMSMATGLVAAERGVEGLFLLDHLSGTLQCWVINPRNGDVAGIFSTNVTEDMELAKGGDIDYVMTTGAFRAEKSTARRGNLIPAGCVCYVGDGNTGKVVGYTLYYDRTLMANNATQQGKLEVLARGVAREAGLQRDN